MTRFVLFLAFLLELFAGPLQAKEWARKMFSTTSHDFGTVARGSKAEFQFELQNIYKEDVHIADVRSSCGCTTAEITRPTLKTWEKGGIIAKYNTRSFLGHRTATVTVTIDKPYFAEVQLNVAGFTRGDVVLSPGSVQFDEVDLGQAAQRTLSIHQVGRDEWKIVDVRSARDFFEAEIIETARGAGRVMYDLVIRLKENAPPGYINEQLIIVTNDQQKTHLPLMVSGRVLSPVTVSPAALTLGVVPVGRTVTKQLVVRAKKPFRITAVRCDDDCFSFKTTDQAKLLHLIPVTFTAGKAAGTVSRRIQIETDLVASTPATCVVTATISSAQSRSAGPTQSTL